MAFKRGVEEIILNTYVAFGNIHQPPTDPTTPEPETLRLYAKPKGGIAWLYWEDETGAIHELAGGAPTVTPSPLTRVNDTNVTLTLGGTPATALLESVSITVSWTGTLAVARGGTNISSYTAGDLLYATGSTTLAKRVIGAEGDVLQVSSGLPVWADISSGGGCCEILVADGMCAPPVMLTSEDECDFLYSDPS